MTATIQEQFEAFDQANPHVYARLEELAAEYLATRPRVGMKMLWEVLRWSLNLAVTPDGSEFKLNNNYTSRYARKLLERNWEWEGRVLVRELQAA